jgi:hypothetical protein
LQHWIVGQQFFGCLFGGIFVRKLGFEMPIDDYRVSNSGDDVSPLNISGLLFFDAESCFFMSAIPAPFGKGQVGPGTG